MIHFQDVHKSFGEQAVLRGIDLQVPDDARLCLVGGSGAGKSVLMKLLLGLEEMDTGEIWLDGKAISEFDKAAWQTILAEFGVVFQGAALFDSLTVRENVGLRLDEARQERPAQVTERVVVALGRVGLEPEVRNKYPAELSGGMQKRVGIARAIIHEPRYLIFDEPTTGLDPVSAGLVDELIAQLADRQGQTTLIVTHDLATVRKLATQVALLAQGSLAFEGTTEAFFGSEAPVVQQFLARER